MVAVMAVVPGCCAVMTLVVASMLATEEVPTLKESVPMDEPQLGTDVTVVSTAAAPEQSAVPFVSKAAVGAVTAPPPPEVMDSSVPGVIVLAEVKLTVAVAPTEPLLNWTRLQYCPTVP